MRILNRKLMVNIEGVETNGSGIYASILHPKGNISVDLIRAGLAKVFDRSLGLLPRETVEAMRAAELEAKVGQRGMWQDFTPVTPSMVHRSYEAVCIEVVSGDTIVVVEGGDMRGGEEKRLTIAGIRVPRMGSIGAGGVKSAHEPWAVECRDLLISAVIGKSVSIREEYTRPAGGSGSTSRVYVSLVVELPLGRGKYEASNLAEHLLASGLCSCVRYKAGSDEERVTNYDSLLIAEARAVEAKKGIHGGTQAPSAKTHGINDVSSDGKKARQYFSLIQGGNKGSAYKGPAIVDYVFSGSRFKITLPYPENCCLQFSLAEVRCPLLGKGAAPAKGVSSSSGATPAIARAAEPFADEARMFSRRRLMQRTVDVELTDMDKNGIALGKLFFSQDGGPKESLSLSLVQEGLAKVDRFLVSRGTSGIESLVLAQEEVRALSKGVWSVPEEEAPEGSSKAADALGSRAGQLARVRVSEIVNGANFYVHVYGVDDVAYPTKTLEQIEELMVSFDEVSICTCITVLMHI
jgi:staphylococcal nuclease domain-containing protein 1